MRHRNEKMKEGNCMIEIEKPQIECIEDSANSSYGKYAVSYTHLTLPTKA